MKTIFYSLAPVAAVFALSSCTQMQSTRSKSTTSSDSALYGHGSSQANGSYQGANPYATGNSYGQYQQSSDSYGHENDYVSVTPTMPQTTNALPQYHGQSQAPAGPHPQMAQMGSYQGAAQPVSQPAYQPMPAQPAAGAQSHVVQQGETLYRISKMYGSTVDGIKGVNGLSSDIIHPGDVLSIP